MGDTFVIDDTDVQDNSGNNILSVMLSDLHQSDAQSVTLAVVYNYNKTEVRDDVEFFEIKLGEIKLTYDALVKIFFNDANNGFSPVVLGKIWQGVQNFSLAAVAVKNYEEKTGISRSEISPEKKVRLYKECAFSNLNSIIKRTYGLTQNEFNYALGSVEVGENGSIATNVIANLYLQSLNIGVRIIFRFVVSTIPPELIGITHATDNSITFDFTSVPTDSSTAEIVIV